MTITLADGKVYQFEPIIDEGCQSFFRMDFATVGFRALPGTVATLTPADGGNVLVQGSQPGGVELYGASDFQVYDPNQYILTLPDGRELFIDQSTGIQSIKDLNDNTLTFTRDGIFHSSGKAVAFNRDAQGRIDSIVDPAGHAIQYHYNVDGDLVAVTDREGHTTTFSYHPQLAHYLQDIHDPRGVRAIRNDYDDDGRLISQTDALGKTITYTHELADRREIVVDRIGAQRVVEYDARGNVTREVDGEGGVTTRTFDINDNRTSETDPNGNTTSWSFDDRDNLLETTDPLGHKTRHTYNDLGQVLTTTDPRGGVTTNAYDVRGNRLSITDALNHTTSFTYNAQGDLRTETDALGKVTEYGYANRNSLPTIIIDRTGAATTYGYDANNRQTTETKTRTTSTGPEQLVTTFVYDRKGNATQTTWPDGSVTRRTFNAIGLAATTIDALGRATSTTYDERGKPIRTTHPDGTSEETAYDDGARPVARKDAANRTTSYQYDRVGRLLKTTHPDGAFTSSHYDPGGRETSSTDARGKVTTYGYDRAGRRTTVIDPLSYRVTRAYDAVGNNTSIQDAQGLTTSFTFDAANRQTVVTFPDATQTVTAYDQIGRRTSETDQAGRTTTFAFDDEGRLLRVTDALGGITRYAYDEVGNQVSQIDAIGHETRFEYDQLGRQTRRILPDGKVETKTYDVHGRTAMRTDLMGRTTTFQYDLADRLTLKTYPDASTVEFTYTATGQRLTGTDGRGVTRYAYDDRDRPTRLTYPDGRRLDYGYDAHGNRTSLTATVGGTSLTTTFTYDDRHQIVTVTDPDGRVYSYNYNPTGMPTSLLLPNGVATNYTYDGLNRLTNLVSKRDTTTLASYAYTLDPTGRRTRVDEAGGSARTYGYDAHYRLTAETTTGLTAPDSSKIFTYDPVGNRVTQVTSGTRDESIEYTYDTRDRLTAETGLTYSWDGNGNVIDRSGRAAYSWDFEDRLRRITKADGTVIEHTYDFDGERVQTTVASTDPALSGTTHFLVDTERNLSHVVAETDGEGALKALYIRAENDLLAVRRPSGLRWYLHDGLGSVTKLVDASGTVTDSRSYSAFGEVLIQLGTDPQPYGFAGEASEPVSGLNYHRARWLDASTGRFLAIDELWARPWSESSQAYGYADQDPVNSADATGLYTTHEASASSIGRANLGAMDANRVAGAAVGIRKAAIMGGIAIVGGTVGKVLTSARERLQVDVRAASEKVRRRAKDRILFHYSSETGSRGIFAQAKIESGDPYGPDPGVYATSIEPWNPYMLLTDLLQTLFNRDTPQNRARSTWFVAFFEHPRYVFDAIRPRIFRHRRDAYIVPILRGPNLISD